MKKILTLFLALLSVNCFAETTYYSDGSSSFRAGDSTYYSDGSSSLRAGDTEYFSDGSSAMIVN